MRVTGVQPRKRYLQKTVGYYSELIGPHIWPCNLCLGNIEKAWADLFMCHFLNHLVLNSKGQGEFDAASKLAL
jgi:hypothetical protein